MINELMHYLSNNKRAQGMANKLAGFIGVVIVVVIFVTSPGADQIIPINPGDVDGGSIEVMVMLLVMAIAVVYILEGN